MRRSTARNRVRMERAASASSCVEQVQATRVDCDHTRLIVTLSDGREIVVQIKNIDWLQWLVNASPKERSNWSIEPGGFAIYWEDLDNGIEICHLLTMEALV